MAKQKLYIVPRQGIDCMFALIHESGEVLAVTWCTSSIYARGELERNKPKKTRGVEKEIW